LGDSDTLNNPIVIPIGGLALNMDYLTIYHLKSIQGNTALLDVKVLFKLNMDLKDIPIEGSGSGEGTMAYDLPNRYPSQYLLTYQINLRIAKDGMIMHMKMSDSLENNCKILPIM